MIRIFNSDGQPVETRMIDLEFSLVAPSVLNELAVDAGFRARRRMGDYRDSEFDETSSPALIVEFEKVSG